MTPIGTTVAPQSIEVNYLDVNVIAGWYDSGFDRVNSHEE
jgi:hypothetical protein